MHLWMYCAAFEACPPGSCMQTFSVPRIVRVADTPIGVMFDQSNYVSDRAL